jgi:hypothetical protein
VAGNFSQTHAAPSTAIGKSMGTSAMPESRNARTYRYNQDARNAPQPAFGSRRMHAMTATSLHRNFLRDNSGEHSASS